MIRFENITKRFWTKGGAKTVADNISLTIPSGVSMALLGRNGAGKSTLLDMIGGTVRPDAGRITATGTVSWRVGYAGSFNLYMTGKQNVRFIARIYGVDTDSLCDFVEDFAELDRHFHLPVRTYSSGMKTRLAFAVSIGMPFDTYLVDEVTSVGDAAFRLKSRLYFEERMKNAGAVVVSHSPAELRNLCQAAAILENGRLTYYEDINEAIARHLETMGAPEDA
jgi:capsular polysaccharide transport system ATP-binding protein